MCCLLQKIILGCKSSSNTIGGHRWKRFYWMRWKKNVCVIYIIWSDLFERHTIMHSHSIAENNSGCDSVRGSRSSSPEILYCIFIYNSWASRTNWFKVSYGWHLLFGTAPCNSAHYCSIGNVQYAHTGPQACMPSATWSNACIVSRHVEMCMGLYW